MIPRSQGFTITEIMISLLIGSIVSLTLISISVTQANMMNRDAQREEITNQTHLAYEVVTRLIRQAQSGTFSAVKNSSSESGDYIELSFELPPGLNVWPNNTSPYDNNSVKIEWTNHEGNGLDISHGIYVSNTPGTKELLVGSDAGELFQIAEFDAWSIKDDGSKSATIDSTSLGGFLIRMTGRASHADNGYVNPDYDSDHPLHHYRTFTSSGIVTPRN